MLFFYKRKSNNKLKDLYIHLIKYIENFCTNKYKKKRIKMFIQLTSLEVD
jgi:hypothetical protein